MSRGNRVERQESARSRASEVQPSRARFNEAGDTLVEVLLALIVLGLASVALLIAFSTSISASATHRRLATSDIVLSAVSQQAISEVNAQLNLFTTCQTLSYFQANVLLSVPSTYQGTYTAAITNVQYWNSTLATFGTACTTDQPEMITVTVTNNGHTYSNSFVVDYPLAGATTQSGAGAASQLVWATPPSTTAVTNTPFSQQPVLQVEDANGNIVTTDLSPAIISIQSGTSGALSGCSGDESNGGVITFTGCELTQAGTYTLMATDGNLTTTLVSDPTITVTGSTSPYLVFTTQPVAGASGSPFSTSPVIKVYLGGSVDTSFPTQSITLATSGGVWPSACSTVTVTNGVSAAIPTSCTFQGGIFYDPVSNQTLGVPYTMTASGNNVLSATSTTFKVSGPGPASQLVFATQPSGVSAASANTAFTTQPIVEIEDAFGNVATSSSATVSLALNPDPPYTTSPTNAALSGCSSTTTKGVATFSGCKVSQFGTGYTVQATSTGLPGVSSSAFNITGLPYALVFTTQPAAGVSGSTLPTEPIITIYDSNNFVVTASTTPITLTASGGSLTLCTNLTPYQGVVTVATCSFAGVVGTNYTLTATQGSLSIVSNPISPSGAGAATQVAFTTDPVAGTAGLVMPTQPIVKIEDSAGNVVLTSSATISLGSSPASGTLSNCGNLQAVSGVVNVTGCTFGGVIGTQYSMSASSASLASDTSANFSPTGPGTIDQIVLSGCVANIQWNQTCTATANAFDTWGNAATTYNAGITFAQVSGTGAVTGLATVTAVNGVATDTLTGSVVGTLQINATGSSVISNTLPITVVGIPQTVAFYTSSGYTTTATSGTTTFSPSGTYQTYAQGSGSGPITFASSTPSVCTVNSSTGLVSIVAAGVCNLTADAGATPHYADSGTTPFTLTINKSANTITITSTAPAAAKVGGATYTPTATATSGDTVVITSGTTAVCTISGGVVSFLTAGSCSLNFNDAGNTNYNAATQVVQTFTVGKGANVITITSTAPNPGVAPSGATYTPTATATSSDAVVVTSATTSVCTVTGGVVSFVTFGTCTLNFNDGGNLNYVAAAQVQQSFTVKHTNAITVTSTAPGSAVVGGATYTPTATATSGVAVVITSNTTSVCTISGGVVSFVAFGTCTLNFNEAGNGNYVAAAQVQQSFSVGKGTQATLTVSSITGTYPTNVSLTTSGGSGSGTVTYAVVNGTATGCTVTGSTLSFSSAGTCLVTATKAADANYNIASSVQTTVTIAKGTQATLTVSSITGTYPTNVSLTTSGGSGSGAVTYAVVNGTATGCTVTGSTLSYSSAGTCLVTATKAADTGYNIASSLQTTVTIAQASQAALTITSTSGTYLTALPITYSGGTTGGTVSYAVVNGTASGCTVTAGALNATSPGTCVVTATMAGNTNYLPVSSVPTTITLGKANQAALLVSSKSGSISVALTLSTSGGSGTGAVTYAVVNGTATGCTRNGSGPYTLTATTSGTCLVTATKALDSDFNVASSAQTTVTMFGTTVWVGGSTGSSSIVSQSFTAPSLETVLVLVTFEGTTARTCNTPTGAALNTYTQLVASSNYYTNAGTFYNVCAYSAEGTGSNSTITELLSGPTTSAEIAVIEITGDNSATLALSKFTSGSNLAPIWNLVSAPPTGNTEFLFGALANGGTPPTWGAIAGFASVGTLTIGTSPLAYSEALYVGAPAGLTITGSTSTTSHWGTVGIEVIP